MKSRSTGILLLYLALVFALGVAIGGLAGYTLARRSPPALPTQEEFGEAWLAKYRDRLDLTPEQVEAIRPAIREAVRDLAGEWYRAVMTMGAIQQRVDRRLEPLLTEDQRHRLVAMVREARLKRLRLAGEKPDPKGRVDHIWYAAATGDTQAIQRHLQRGADVNELDLAFGTTPLAVAAMHGQPEAVQLLLAAGADVNQPLSDGNTALHAAAFFGQSACVRLLLAHGADPFARNRDGKTPLEAMEADWETIQFIADILQVQLDKQATLEGRKKVAELLRAAMARKPSAAP
ncbi:MAG: ankyrin repeat domain-containing protein [Verrucomicrobia bacterium]|nr:MAG: ankyrin repeat domain-containing protein [Verrucomicrobiota bacterium]